MNVLTGKKIAEGLAIGKIRFLNRPDRAVSKEPRKPEDEWKRFLDARERAIEELQQTYERTLMEVGEKDASIFTALILLMQDQTFAKEIQTCIQEKKKCAIGAVLDAEKKYKSIFLQIEDEYFRSKARDMEDITERILKELKGKKEPEEGIEEESIILAAQSVSTSVVANARKNNIAGIVSKYGSLHSHTAILARTLGIPFLTGVNVDELSSGMEVILDGFGDRLFTEPSDTQREYWQGVLSYHKKDKEDLAHYIGEDSKTRSGRSLRIRANVNRLYEVDAAIENDADGIGLYRSEFLYMVADHLPTEDEQFLIYKELLEKMKGKRVIIRTMDIGADKQTQYLQFASEENPAMGYRAIRVSLNSLEIFRTQLRALYRASIYGNMSILYPMIISVDEVRKVREISASIRKELTEEGMELPVVEEGIMIETPASALISEELAKEVDFFSVGTNDLTQFTLAIDRQNETLDNLFNVHHPAVLKLIQMAVKSAKDAGIQVNICGELGADTEMTEAFLNMGVDALSVSPDKVLRIRRKLMSLD